MKRAATSTVDSVDVCRCSSRARARSKRVLVPKGALGGQRAFVRRFSACFRKHPQASTSGKSCRKQGEGITAKHDNALKFAAWRFFAESGHGTVSLHAKPEPWYLFSAQSINLSINQSISQSTNQAKQNKTKQNKTSKQANKQAINQTSQFVASAGHFDEASNMPKVSLPRIPMYSVYPASP